jgi:hypothetical protein
MKVAVGLDEDGHFMLSNIENRKDTINLLKKISDGDLWENDAEDNLENCDLKESDLYECPLGRFEQFVYQFQCRGRIEIKEI